MVSPSPSPTLSSEALKIDQLTRQLQWAELKIQVLEERLRLELSPSSICWHTGTKYSTSWSGGALSMALISTTEWYMS
jgi:hypothetical protein